MRIGGEDVHGFGGALSALWHQFRRWPLWVQLVLWLFFWWALFFVWAGTLAGRRRVVAVVTGLAVLIGIGATGGQPDDKPTAVAAAQGGATSETTASPSTTASTTASPSTTTTASPAPPTTSTAPPTTVAVTTTTAARTATTARSTATTARPTTTTTARPATTTTQATTANYVYPGAYCSPAGAAGYSKNGVPMTCSTVSCTGEPYDKPRWRKTSC